MPEGDTVHRTAQRLHAALAGEPLVLADLRWPSLATARLTGWTTLEVVARGKHVLHRFAEGHTLHSHLRMEGQWRVEHPGPASDRLLRDADLRVALGTATWHAFGLRLGMLDLLPRAHERDVVGHLGPDLLGADWDLDVATDRLVTAGRDRPDLLVAEALLDKRIVCGIGTFWASEGLFIGRIHPWSPLHTIAPAALRSLLARTHDLMARAARTGWQSSTGSERRGEPPSSTAAPDVTAEGAGTPSGSPWPAGHHGSGRSSRAPRVRAGVPPPTTGDHSDPAAHRAGAGGPRGG